MQNDIYDMDKKMFLTNGSLSTPTRSSSQSSYTSNTSGYSNNSSTGTITLQQYDDRTYDIAPYTSFYNNTTPPTSAYSPGSYVQKNNMNLTNGGVAGGYTSQLVILEQPAEKFRFRYKSEMHGTHGSLNGSRSEKNKKTFPEVELKNFNGVGVIRCSLYQTTDKPSPHSHQLVVRKDDSDERDPHDLRVSPEKGYIARFENMGIIHTAKKNICEELYSKKKQKMKFETGCERLSQRQEKILRDEAESEAKNMNLNQVRLCFEAFEIVNEGSWKRICEPVFSKPINNRKSALTGELKICRMSTVVGSAAGGEDIILLVEKVSKKNIQVRFFEMVDDEFVWDAYGDFSDADVHHQYAIVVRTPPYKNKDIDTNVNVFIELVRKSDDERSAPLGFRYKPRDIILSRKRRRTSYTSSTSSPVSSSELPKPIIEGMQQQQHMQSQFTPFHMAQPPQQQQHPFHYQQQNQPQTISQEFNKDEQINALFNMDTVNDTYLNRSAPTNMSSDYTYQVTFNSFLQKVRSDSEELKEIAFENDCLTDMLLQTDGEGTVVDRKRMHFKPRNLKSICELILAINKCDQQTLKAKRNEIRNIFEQYVAASENGDTIIHEIVKQDNISIAMPLMKILSELQLTDLLSQINNCGQTPLHIACLYDQNIFIRPLLNLNCDPNIQDKDGNTILHIAVNENLTHCLNAFLSFHQSNKGATKLNANLANDNGLTPLHLAIRQDYTDIAEILLKKFDASAKIACSCDGNNALHLAVQHQNYKMVKVILDNSEVKLNSKNQSGHTAIDLANTLEGSVKQEILNLLLDRDAPPRSKESSPLPLEKKTINEDSEQPDEDVDVSSSDDEDQKPNITELEEQNREELIKRTLKNDEIQSSLAKLLIVEDKWKKLATILKQEHMLLLCNSAKSMLRHIIERIDEIGIWKVVDAIETLNPKAVDAILPSESLSKDSR